MPQGTKLVLPAPTPVENQWPAASVFFTSSPGASNTQPGPEPFMLPNPIFFFFLLSREMMGYGDLRVQA